MRRGVAALACVVLASVASADDEIARDAIRDDAIHQVLGRPHETRIEGDAARAEALLASRVVVDGPRYAPIAPLPVVQSFRGKTVELGDLLGAIGGSVGYDVAFQVGSDAGLVIYAALPANEMSLEGFVMWLSYAVNRNIVVFPESKLITVMPGVAVPVQQETANGR
jgi:hypothetical protein